MTSLQAGIQVSDDLRELLAQAVLDDSNIRFIKIVIEEEQMVLADKVLAKGKWRDQYNSCIEHHLQPSTACYMFYRLDSKNSYGYEWLYLTYIHEYSSVKQKMLYSATAGTLKATFGLKHLAAKGLIHGSSPDEFTLEGYDKHLTSANAPPPLSMAEEEHLMVKEMEKTEMAVSDRKMTLKGLEFAVGAEASKALAAFQRKELDYLEILIHMEGTEELRVGDKQEQLRVDQLPGKISAEHPAYILYRFQHKYEGTKCAPIVFIYSTPGYKGSIKQRMVYSSGKSFFVELCKSLNIVVDRNLEIDTPTDVSEDNLIQELHPPTSDGRQKFDKPRAPGRKAPKK